MTAESAPRGRLAAEAREDRILSEFCQTLQELEGGVVQLVRRPDREDPGTGGCDALIERGGKMCAVEHTTLDAFPLQRGDSHRFRAVVAPLEQSIPDAIPDSFVRITVPVHAVPTGLPWGQLRDLLKARCIEAIQRMAALPPWEDRFERFDFADVPFPVYVSRQYWPEDPGCLVSRFAPSDKTDAMKECVQVALAAKQAQLRGYHALGHRTILILDSDERALINDRLLAEAFAAAITGDEVREIDEVFFAESKRHPAWFYPLKIGARVYPDLPEYEAYRAAQFRLCYGDMR